MRSSTGIAVIYGWPACETRPLTAGPVKPAKCNPILRRIIMRSCVFWRILLTTLMLLVGMALMPSVGWIHVVPARYIDFLPQLMLGVFLYSWARYIRSALNSPR